MASQKKPTKKGSNKGELATVRRLTQKAQDELRRLLERNRTGILSQEELVAELEELDKHLQKIAMHEFRL